MRGAGSGPVGVPGGQIPANPGSVALCLLCRVVGPGRAWCCGAPQHPVLGVHGTAHTVLVPALYPPRLCSPPALHPPALALRAPPHVAPAPLANPWARLDYRCPPALIRSCHRAGRAAPALLAPIPSTGACVPSRDPLAMGRAAHGGTGLVGPCQGFSLGTAPVPPHPLLGALLGRCRSPGSPFWGCHGSNPDQSRARVPGAARPCCGVPRVGSECRQWLDLHKAAPWWDVPSQPGHVWCQHTSTAWPRRSPPCVPSPSQTLLTAPSPDVPGSALPAGLPEQQRQLPASRAPHHVAGRPSPLLLLLLFLAHR